MISVPQIVELQQETVAQWHVGEPINPYPVGDFFATVCQQHLFNFLLWHEEDIARSQDVTDSEIARVKRSIDGLNQQRNDWIEKIDDQISELLLADQVKSDDSAKMNTETPGSTIDRLSILALRLYHLREQLERKDVDSEHLRSVERKLATCQVQQDELATSLQELLHDLFTGRKRHRTYRQLKMYNDPTLNPVLYRQRSEQPARSGS